MSSCLLPLLIAFLCFFVTRCVRIGPYGQGSDIDHQSPSAYTEEKRAQKKNTLFSSVMRAMYVIFGHKRGPRQEEELSCISS